MLKMTEIELELISDNNMHYFIDKGIRGDISYISKRYINANNKYIPYQHNIIHYMYYLS